MGKLNTAFAEFKELGKEIKRYFKDTYGMDVTTNRVGTNKTRPLDHQWYSVSPKDWRVESIPNDLRLKAVRIIGGEPSYLDDVNYGNVQRNRISLHCGEWRRLFEQLNAEA